MLRILHTSDVQLDAPFHFLGNKGQQHRQQLQDTFRHIVDVAAESEYDLLLVAGDLFNDNRPYQGTLDFVISQLGRLVIPVCILPGNHDCYDDASVYRKARFPDNVTLFTGQPTIQEFPKLDVSVYGNAILSSQSRANPLNGLVRSRSTRWHIALAHGNLVRPDIVDPPRPIRPKDISASGMDYVAMGDWHIFEDYSQGGVKAYYSGAPEPTAMSQTGAGYVACVEMDERGVRVHPERVGTVSVDECSIDILGKSSSQVAEELRAHSDPNVMLKATFRGLADLGTVLDTDVLEQDMASCFYHIECSDESQPQLQSISSDDFPEELVIGKYIRLMQAQIDNAADDGQRRRAEQALQVGVALLQGRRVL